ncbi:MAG: aldehyde dehydrogenase [Rhodospirillales bacterium]|nr:aldehyde dehydrogenase [Rhodospirillales bacterium]
MARTKNIVLERRAVVARILAGRGDALVVTGLGSTTWDTAAAGDTTKNLYLWGGMGAAAMCGLGLALAQPGRRVLVVTGDGEMLMGLGSLASIAVQKPANLAVCVIDNERYGETGMQRTATSFGVDLPGMARAAGFAETAMVRTEKQLAAIAPRLFAAAGPLFVAIKVTANPVPMVLPPRDGPWILRRFRHDLLGPRAAD